MGPGEVQTSLALRSAFRIFGFAQDRMRFGIALNKNFDFLRLCSHLSLSLALPKIGCGSEKHIQVNLICFSLTFHYLCIIVN